MARTTRRGTRILSNVYKSDHEEYPKTVATNLGKETGSLLSFFPIAYRSVSRTKVVNWGPRSKLNPVRNPVLFEKSIY